MENAEGAASTYSERSRMSKWSRRHPEFQSLEWGDFSNELR